MLLYRSLLPTPVWYRFFLNKDYGSLFSSLMTGLYLTFKLTSVVEKVSVLSRISSPSSSFFLELVDERKLAIKFVGSILLYGFKIFVTQRGALWIVCNYRAGQCLENSNI